MPYDHEAITATCDICGITAGEYEIMEAGWEPYFWWTEKEHADGPACPDCSRKYLTDHANDPIVKPGVELPEPGRTTMAILTNRPDLGGRFGPQGEDR